MAEFGVFDTIINKVVGGVAGMALGAAKAVTDEFMKDTPSIIATDPTNMAVTDIPRVTDFVGVLHNDAIAMQNEVLSIQASNAMLMTSIVERCKIPSRIQIVNWTSSMATGTAIAVMNVNPCVSTTVSGTGYTEMEGTALSIFAQYFQYWRGGLRFTVECMPSQFHQGQLYLAFNPNMTAMSLYGARNCTSATIDLGVNNRTSLDIPYVSSSDYLTCPIFNQVVTTSDLTNSLGTFSVFVQNELDHNGSVVGNIDVNIYIEALDDFEFKVPRSLAPKIRVFYDGTYQMDEEVVRNVHSAVPDMEFPTKIGPSNVQNAAIVANVKTADTINIMSREYLIATGNTVAMTEPPGTQSYTSLFPSSFFATDLATTGLFNYHELFRMDFRFTIRINPTPFNQGALIVYWSPGDQSNDGSCFGTTTQYPHAILNVGSETSASIVVPYSSVFRMLRGSNADMGSLKVAVWNQIKAPVSAPQNLKFSVWAQALNVHMAVKRQVGSSSSGIPPRSSGILQGELSDTATQQQTQQVAFEAQTRSRGGFMEGRHDNVLTLLRRFMFGGHADIRNVDDAAKLPITWGTSCFFGREHVFLKETYAFSSGSQRIMIGSNSGRGNPITGFVVPLFDTQVESTLGPAGSIADYDWSSWLGGAIQFYPGDTQQRIIEIPYYSQIPLVSNKNASIQPGNAWTEVAIGYKNQTTSDTLVSYLWHAVGDDYMVYYPVGLKRMRHYDVAPPRVSAFEEVDPDFDRLLKAGDVESNPGPDDVDVYVLHDICDCLKTYNCHDVRELVELPDGRIRMCAFNYDLFDSLVPVGLQQFVRELRLDRDEDEAAFGQLIVDFDEEAFHEYVEEYVDPEYGRLTQAGDVEANPGPDDFAEIVLHDTFMCVVRTEKFQIVVDEGKCILICQHDPLYKRLEQSGDVESNPGPAFPYTADVAKAADSIISAAGELKEAIPEMKSTCSSVKIAADESSRMAAAIREWLHNVKEKPLDGLKPIAEPLIKLAHTVIAQVMGIFSNVYQLYEGGKGRVLAALTLITQLSQYMSTSLLNKLQSVVSSMGLWQGLSDFTILISLAPAIIGSILSVFSCEFGHDDQRSFKFRLNEKLEDCKGLKDTVAAVFHTIVEYVFEGTGWGVNWYKHSHAELVKFVQDVDRAKAEKKFTAVSLKNEVVRAELKRLFRFAQKVKAYGPVLPRFNLEYMKASDIVVEWSKIATGAVQCSRVPTIGVAFEGSSGVGKSFLASNVLPAILMVKIGKASSAEEGKSMVWNKPTGAESHFYDGYCQQSIAYIDDFLKTVEAKDAQDVINMISCSQYPVDMARLEDKGMLFKSDFLFVTTNTKNFAAVHGLTHAEALCTRFKHAVNVSARNPLLTGAQVVSGFTDDLKDVKTVDELMRVASKYWVLKKLDVKGGVIGDVISFEWFVQNIVDTYKSLHVSHDRLEAAFKGITQGDDYFDCDEGEDVLATRRDVEPGSLDSYMYEYRETIFNPEYAELESDYRDLFLERAAEAGIVRGKVLDLKNLDSWRNMRAEDLYATLCPPSKWKGLLKMLAIAGVVAAAAFAIYKLAKMLLGDAMGVFQGKAYDNVRVKPKPRPSGIMQGVDDKMTRIRKNIRKIDIYDIDTEDSLGRMHGLMHGGKRILVPRHFWMSLVAKRRAGINCFMRVEKLTPHGEHDGYIRVGFESVLAQDVVTDDGQLLDLTMVHMHNVNVNGARHIERMIPTIRDHRNMLAGRLLAGRILKREDLEDVSVQLGRRGTMPYRSEDDEVFFMMIAELPSGVKTKGGDCGFPYMLMDDSIACPLVGMHSALITSLEKSPAGCTPLVREWIERACAKLDCFAKTTAIEPVGVLQGDGTKSAWWTSDIHCEGKVEMNGIPLQVFPLKKTDYRKWLQHEEWEDKFLPSEKRCVNGRHALYSNAQKHEVTAAAIVPLRAHQMCVRQYCSKFEVSRDCHVLSEYEMINGFAEMTSVVMNTSCGFISKWFKDGKKELFESSVDGLNPAVWSFTATAREKTIPIYDMSFTERLKFVEEEMMEGRVPYMLWVATLKDELRGVEKVEAVKTRVFEQPPLELTLLIRKYFGSFLNWVKSHHGPVSHSAIGIDKEAVWRAYWLSLKSKGNKGFDVDYSNYDGSVCSQAFDFFREVTDAYYRDTNPVRHALLFALQNAWMIVGDYVVFTEQGNKSGNPMTDVFNSITNVYVIYLSYLQGRVEKGLSMDFTDFDRDVVCLTYGDDVICAVDDATGEYFNRLTVAKSAAMLGMSVTAADKGAELVALQDLKELTFLKSHFVENGPLVLAPMPKEVAIRELQFIKKRNMQDKRIQGDIVENAMHFMSHRGRAEMEQLREQLASQNVHTSFSYEDFYLGVAEKQAV